MFDTFMWLNLESFMLTLLAPTSPSLSVKEGKMFDLYSSIPEKFIMVSSNPWIGVNTVRPWCATPSSSLYSSIIEGFSSLSLFSIRFSDSDLNFRRETAYEAVAVSNFDSF